MDAESKNRDRRKTVAVTMQTLITVSVSLAVGCVSSTKPVPMAAPDVPYVSGDEVDRLVVESKKPALLEFCVPVGCFRCDEMRRSVNDLAQSEAGRVTVRRVNLNTERRLAAEWGVTVCPTYVVVADGREVERSQYPTSADLIAAMIPYQPARD